MDTKPRKKKRDYDFSVNALRVVQEATKEPEQVSILSNAIIGQGGMQGKNPAAIELGRLGGKKGGPARAKKLTPERRREIATRAAQKRWAGGRTTLTT